MISGYITPEPMPIHNPLYDLDMHPRRCVVTTCVSVSLLARNSVKGLWLYHVLWKPETWARMCERVSGAASGALYANEEPGLILPCVSAYQNEPIIPGAAMRCSAGARGRKKRQNITANKIAVDPPGIQTRGFPDDIPDEQENDLGSPGYSVLRRIRKTLIKNDFWCRTLSFSP